MAGTRILGVFQEHWDQHIGIKQINAHRSVNLVGIRGHAQLGCLWFFLKPQNPVIAIHIHNSEAGHFIGIDLNRCQGHIRS